MNKNYSQVFDGKKWRPVNDSSLTKYVLCMFFILGVLVFTFGYTLGLKQKTIKELNEPMKMRFLSLQTANLRYTTPSLQYFHKGEWHTVNLVEMTQREYEQEQELNKEAMKEQERLDNEDLNH
jgi:hypothetical protein